MIYIMPLEKIKTQGSVGKKKKKKRINNIAFEIPEFEVL